MNMFKPVKAISITQYFDMLPAERREPLLKIQQLILETAPSLKPNFIYNMPGYGTIKYTNSKKQEVDWPLIAIASQKNYMSIYVCATANHQYLPEKYSSELGKVNVGKSCIRFKKLEDLDLTVLKKVIKEAAMVLN